MLLTKAIITHFPVMFHSTRNRTEPEEPGLGTIHLLLLQEEHSGHKSTFSNSGDLQMNLLCCLSEWHLYNTDTTETPQLIITARCSSAKHCSLLHFAAWGEAQTLLILILHSENVTERLCAGGWWCIDIFTSISSSILRLRHEHNQSAALDPSDMLELC